MSSENVNRISSLPEDVLSHILSLMATKFAVQTSILSKRWRYSWTWITNLDFYGNCPDRLSKFVDRVLELCKTSQIKLFRLRFSGFLVKRASVSKWIDKAVRLNVSELGIQVSRVELPLSVFTCKSLTKLTLVQGSYELDIWKWPSIVNLPCLTTLDIRVFKNPSFNAFRLINGCPILESLFLQIALAYDEEEEYNFNIPSLKRLNLKFLHFGLLEKVVLNLPNLHYLFFSGKLFFSFLVVEDLSSLVEASFSYGEINHLVQSTSTRPKFPNLRRLKFKYFRSGCLLITQFLKSSTKLEHLCIKELSCLCLKQKPKESCWVKPKSVPACMLTNLTTMEYTNCKGQKCDIQFLKYMLGNAQVLKTLTITCENLCIEEIVQLYAQLIKFRRASKYCEIHFLGN